MYKITKDVNYFNIAKLNLFYLKDKQLNYTKNLRGGFFGSVPFYGSYGRFKLLNWNNKYFIDAMLKYYKFNISYDEEQSLWVKANFQKKNIISSTLSITDHRYLNFISKVLKKGKYSYFLDIGCGKGKYINFLKKKFKNIFFYGFDPTYSNKKLNISLGSLYKNNLNKNNFDIVILIEVLQHTSNLDQAIKLIKKFLKKNKKIVIADRNKLSVLGFLKPFLEYFDLWMYSKDSPFREKWYYFKEWKKVFKENNLKIISYEKINTSAYGLPFFNNYIIFELENG